ncbi:MAG: SusC/RagA family TonB-linked outer membrane protein [Chitinophagaceae bacterium]|nr:SusC/RagA family TonB-linked outer membrane protein [Chitinophagaceae bacterium]
MRFLGFLLTVVCTQTYSLGLSQEKISLECKNVTLKQALAVIESRSSYRFLYHDSIFSPLADVSISVRNKPVLSIVDQLIAGTLIHYRVLDDNLVVFAQGAPLVRDSVIKGHVTDEKGSLLPGVTVEETGTKNATVTDAKGDFLLHVRNLHGSLNFSYVGYNKKRVNLEGKAEISVQLTASSLSLSETVVVGYQRTSQKLTTAAVQTINGKDIENLPAPSFDQLLQGRVSGVNIQNFTGEPGVRGAFVVRGNTTMSTVLDPAKALSSPLYVIDGVPLNLDDIGTFDNTSTNYLAGINVNDIESIQVQKDAAATASWGSRGANGVVVIRTKRGRSPRPRFEINYYQGVVNRPDLMPTVMGAEERRQKLNLLYQYGNYYQLGGPYNNSGLFISDPTGKNNNGIPQILTDSLNPAFNNATDWQNIFYHNGSVKNADVSMSASNDLVNYRISMNYYDENGVLRASGLTRYSIRGNFDIKISEKASAQLLMSASRTDRKRGLGGNPYSGNALPLDGPNLPASFYRLSKTDSLKYMGQYDLIRDQNQNDNFTLFTALNYDIIKGLRYSVQGSFNTSLNRRDYFSPSNIASNIYNGNYGTNVFTTSPNYAESDNSTYNQYNINNILTYFRTWKDHTIALTGTQSFQRELTQITSTSGSYLPSDVVQTVTAVPQNFIYGYSDKQAASLLSYVGQAQYDFKQKYIVAASWRADASSRFGANTKWGYFPSVSAAWLLSEESFMKSTADWLTLFKFRGSWGKSGQQPTDFYAPFNSYNLLTGPNSTPGSYNGVPAVTPDYKHGITLTNLTWATTTQWDLGFDAYFLNNRVNLTVDYYNKQSNNQFFTFNFPAYIGYSSQTSNAPLGIRNNGVEVLITTHNMSPQNPFQWNTNFNISFNHNVITSLPFGNQTIIKDNTIFSVGQPLYRGYQMIYAGVYNNASEIPVNPNTGNPVTYFNGNHRAVPGDPIWVDVQHQYDVWFGNNLPTINPNPRFTGGFINDFTYKNFSLSVVCAYTLGRDIINSSLSSQFAAAFGNFYSPTNASAQIYSFASTRLPDLRNLNYWVPAAADKDPNGYHAGFQSLSPYKGYYYQYGTGMTEFNRNGSYLRIKNISLGYRVPDKYLKPVHVSSLRIYAMMDNVAMFQKAKDVPDAEQVNAFGIYNGNGYPIPKKYTIGVNVQL